jgi:endonuclease YncB( thermonuclease family)
MPRQKTLDTQNSYKIIEGFITIIGKQPDGDSIGFIPKTPDAFEGVYRSHLLKTSPKDGSVQLRFEGIDAPELHYVSEMQPYSKSSRDYLLNLCRFFNIAYKLSNGGESVTVNTSKPERIKAYIATNGFEPHGRPISYLFLGANDKNGKISTITTEELKQSLNYKMLAEGYAYLLTYSSMPKAHIDLFRAAAVRAKIQRKNIWAVDRTSNFAFLNKQSVEGYGAQLIFPKLFRRCMDYFKTDMIPTPTLTEWMRKGHDNDMVLQFGNNQEVPFSSFIKQRNSTIEFTADTNYLIFIEK